MIINVQIFTFVRLLRKAKILLATLGIYQLPSHGTNECAIRTADQQHKKKNGGGSDPSIKITKLWLSFFFFKVGNIG